MHCATCEPPHPCAGLITQWRSSWPSRRSRRSLPIPRHRRSEAWPCHRRCASQPPWPPAPALRSAGTDKLRSADFRFRLLTSALRRQLASSQPDTQKSSISAQYRRESGSQDVTFFHWGKILARAKMPSPPRCKEQIARADNRMIGIKIMSRIKKRSKSRMKEGIKRSARPPPAAASARPGCWSAPDPAHTRTATSTLPA